MAVHVSGNVNTLTLHPCYDTSALAFLTPLFTSAAYMYQGSALLQATQHCRRLHTTPAIHSNIHILPVYCKQPQIQSTHPAIDAALHSLTHRLSCCMITHLLPFCTCDSRIHLSDTYALTRIRL